jgi:uncharacterized protein YheU (UPF0270 family)
MMLLRESTDYGEVALQTRSEFGEDQVRPQLLVLVCVRQVCVNRAATFFLLS